MLVDAPQEAFNSSPRVACEQAKSMYFPSYSPRNTAACMRSTSLIKNDLRSWQQALIAPSVNNALESLDSHINKVNVMQQIKTVFGRYAMSNTTSMPYRPRGLLRCRARSATRSLH